MCEEGLVQAGHGSHGIAGGMVFVAATVSRGTRGSFPCPGGGHGRCATLIGPGGCGPALRPRSGGSDGRRLRPDGRLPPHGHPGPPGIPSPGWRRPAPRLNPPTVDEAAATAGQGLAANPNQPLALHAAAQAAEKACDEEGARRLYVGIIDAWDTEGAGSECRTHVELLASAWERARRFVESGWSPPRGGIRIRRPPPPRRWALRK